MIGCWHTDNRRIQGIFRSVCLVDIVPYTIVWSWNTIRLFGVSLIEVVLDQTAFAWHMQCLWLSRRSFTTEPSNQGSIKRYQDWTKMNFEFQIQFHANYQIKCELYIYQPIWKYIFTWTMKTFLYDSLDILGEKIFVFLKSDRFT